jgi:hypothetical protein
MMDLPAEKVNSRQAAWRRQTQSSLMRQSQRVNEGNQRKRSVRADMLPGKTCQERSVGGKDARSLAFFMRSVCCGFNVPQWWRVGHFIPSANCCEVGLGEVIKMVMRFLPS